jgi:uncharacterized membrane protein
MKTPRMYYGALAVFCVIALCIGYASAADITQATHTSTHGKGIEHPAFDLTNTTVQQEVLARFEKQGVDTTGLATAFQSGNMTDVKSWMEAHRPAAPGVAKGSFGKAPDYTNTTVQQEVLARYAKQGVDTTGLAAAFQSGNMTDVKSWMEAHRPARPQFTNNGPSKGFDMTNTTVQQEILVRYAKQGVDTTGLATAFQSGNMTDVKSWMEAHRPAAPGVAKGSFGKAPDYTNTTVQQEVLARYAKQGVDTTGLAAAFQSGNMTDVKSWMVSHRPAAPGVAKGSFGKAPDYTNTTVQQEVLARYQKQGVDTTGLAAAFQSGNMTDVKSWMVSHRPAAPGVAKGSFGKAPNYTNTTVQQQILARYQKQGVDTTGLAAAFQNGDTAAVKSWFDVYVKAHPHTQKSQSGNS